MRKCSKDGHTRIFYSNGKSDCLQCKRESASRSRKRPEVKSRKDAYEKERNKNPIVRRSAHSRHLRHTLGIGIEDYEKMALRQNGVCAICGNTNGSRRLCVDHNHNTGKIRGLLCTKCNVWVGVLENAPWKDLAIPYLESYEPS